MPSFSIVGPCLGYAYGVVVIKVGDRDPFEGMLSLADADRVRDWSKAPR